MRHVDLLPTTKALTLVRKMLGDLGYMQMGVICQGSAYFSKKGFFHMKIRVSDHPFDVKHDVIHAITIDGPTIMPDVEFRVRRADEVFRAEMRNQTRKKAAR